jgi:uncharacterized protein YjbI with pentapeptide repeats
MVDEQAPGEWPTCAEPGCKGVQLGAGDRCLAHLVPEDDFAGFVRVEAGDGPDARGVRVDEELWARILAAARRDTRGRPVLRGARFCDAILDVAVLGQARFEEVSFQGALFRGGTSFEGASFAGRATFTDAVFEQETSFARSSFAGDARFDRATFADVSFDGAAFSDHASFEGLNVTGFGAFAAAFGSSAWFGGATFGGDTRFARASFVGDAGFNNATFGGTAWFNDTAFNTLASFRRATFGRQARFESAAFEGAADFDRATFVDHAQFGRARFAGTCDFSDAAFRGQGVFRAAVFAGDAEFDRASFAGDAWFDEARFAADVKFHDATVEQCVGFTDAGFERPCYLGPLRVLGSLVLDGVTFEDAVQIVVSANGLSCVAARFRGRALLEVRWAEIALDRAEFGRPTIITAAAPAGELDETPLAAICRGSGAGGDADDADEARTRGRSDVPRMVSLRRTDVANLTLADVDLHACRFDGAHNLPALRVEGTDVFERTPRSYRGTRRQAIAEEHEWRRDHPRRLQSRGWYPPSCAHPDWLPDPVTLQPHEIAAIYRDLRKGREDNKDEPGAADFYYGEMEMRRYAAQTPRAERAIIWLYWLVSGYGLRASRTLVALALTIVVFAVLLYAVGMQDPDFSMAFLQSVQGAAFRAGDPRVLTEGGQYLQLPLRLLGPLFLGLMIVSLRGRVKR